MISWVEWVVQPDRIVLGCLVVAVACLVSGRVVTGRRIVYWVFGGILTLSIAPVGEWLVSPLEDRFPRPISLPAGIVGILVLAGGEDTNITASRGVASLNGAADRLVEAAIIARAYPDLPILFSGGGTGTSESKNHAFTARLIFSGLGLDSARIVYEDKSRTTAESAALARRFIPDTSGWLLLTSANHMPRAVGAFRAQGWDVVAFPVDYHTGGTTVWGGFSFMRSAGMLSIAIHEWGGLIWYRISGRTQSLFPAP